jgi:hypothetical protein
MQTYFVQLFDPILQNAQDCLWTAQGRKPYCRCIDLRRLDGKKDEIDRASDLRRIRSDRPGHGDDSIAILQCEVITGGTATQQRGSADFVKCRRNRGADGTRAHDGDGCLAMRIHQTPLTSMRNICSNGNSACKFAKRHS